MRPENKNQVKSIFLAPHVHLRAPTCNMCPTWSNAIIAGRDEVSRKRPTV